MQRPSNELATGTDDDTIPFVDPLSSFSVVLRLELEPIWEVFLVQGDRAADHVHPPLLGDVPQGGEPGLAPVPGGSEVNLHTPGIQSVTRQRHVILPADQTAKLTEGGVEDPERAAVTLCPHHALWGGWHQHLVLSRRDTPHPVRIGGDEGFGEDHQANATLSGFGDQLAGFGNSGFAVLKYWRVLHGGYPEGRHCLNLPFAHCRY